MSNLIASRIADFLKLYPPFDGIQPEDLDKISGGVVVKYFTTDDFVFHQGDEKSELLYIVKEGVVHLERQEKDQVTLVDICDEGDLFGVRAMLTGKPYVFHARCIEECLIYGVPISLFKPLLEKQSSVALFFASGLAGGQTLFNNGNKAILFQDSGSLLNWNRPLTPPERALIAADPKDPIRNVAKLMNEQNVGSVVICNEDDIIGIVTDTDFRKKVGVGEANLDSPVADIMSKNVVTMPVGKPLSTYLLQMLKNKIRHICITDNEYPIGMLSERDLMAAQQNHPVALAYAMEEANSTSQLATLRNRADGLIQFYLEQNVSIALTSSLTTHINDVLIQRAIELSLEHMKGEYGEPPVPFCWLSLGSEGREEQLIRTDQDNAILFEDVEAERLEEVQTYFIRLASQVNGILESSGFENCPADMMASNVRWCQPLSIWKGYFTGWIKEPAEKAIMLSTIFFDFRSVYGSLKLEEKLKAHISETIVDDRIFLNFLAKNALKNPAPLGFFKNFMVERSGEHENEFDIKARAMMPLVDIARVLTLDCGSLKETNTMKRYTFLADQEPKKRELYLQAAEAYEYLMRFRAQHGFKHGGSGRYVSIHELNKLDRQILRNTFEPIDRLQKMLEVRYQLSYFQ
ncbi:MAG: DUF294 nucleotidyltransferase-like domain-containing protein [Bacteroidota bacterium]